MTFSFQRSFLFVVLLGALVHLSLAQDVPATDAKNPQAITTVDPTVALENLDLLLEPLTMSELGIEAVGWRDLLKASVQALSDAQLATRKKNQEIDAAADVAADTAKVAETSQTEVADAETEEAEKKDEKVDLLTEMTELQDAKTSLLERFNLVLNNYEEKGGDPSEYRTYAQAVSGIKLEVDDLASSWAAVIGWLKSKEGGIKWALGLAKFLGIMLVFWVIAKIASRVVRKITSRHLNWSALLERFVNKLTKRVVLMIGLLIALSTMGVNVGALLALIGGSAFIIGFALQDTLGNFAAGLMLLLYRPFDVGDVVEIGGVSGKVAHVSLVSTTINSFDNKVVLVPNKNVWGQTITNATASGERRVDMTFGIGYDDDFSKAQKILEKIVASSDKVLKQPEPNIKMNELADSSVNFICRPWTKTADYWDVYWEITRKVKEEFDAAGISIPYPQQDVHIHRTD